MKHLLPPALLMPTAALAHPGHHDGFGLGDLVAHIVSHPDHAVLFVLAVGAAVVLLRRARS